MKNTVVTFKQAKEKGEKLTMLTAYDYSTAKLIDEAGINAILVGGRGIPLQQQIPGTKVTQPAAAPTCGAGAGPP